MSIRLLLGYWGANCEMHFYKGIIVTNKCIFNIYGVELSQNYHFRAQGYSNFSVSTKPLIKKSKCIVSNYIN